MNEQMPLPFLQIDGQSVRQTPELTSLRKLPTKATFGRSPTAAARNTEVIIRAEQLAP